jgi:putative PIN family toxin of toxin-antitoxin system
MTSKARYVFDTNTIVSALLFEQSKPGQAFFTALRRGEVLVSLPLLVELQTVLGHKKFDRYLLPEERERFLARLVLEATLIDVTAQIEACRDPKDDKVLELAVSGNATYIITGDQDLLELNPFQHIPIVTPADFLVTQAGES